MRKNIRPGGSPGVTKGASVESGLSSHSQISDSLESLGKGQGQGDRPKAHRGSETARGKKFPTR